MLIQATADVANYASHVLAASPSLSGGGVAPPGSEKVVTLLKWGLWIATACCLAGVLISAGKMALASRQGGHGGVESASGLIWVFAAMILLGSASAIVTALS